MHLPYLLTIKNTYLSLTPNYLDKHFLTPFPHSPKRSLSTHKQSIHSRNSRIRQIGYSTTWYTFITLTFSNDYYWSDYSIFQSCFRKFIKALYYRTSFTSFSLKYLGVLEHGGVTNRIHFHILTNIPFNADIFIRPKKIKGVVRKIVDKKIWHYGFTDVIEVSNKPVNAVHYLIKYLGKNYYTRPPVGKREVFASRGLNKSRRVIVNDISPFLLNCDRALDLGHSIIFYKAKNKKSILNHKAKKILRSFK